MSLTITFELDDSDIEHFLAMAREAQEAVASSGMGADEITNGARELFAKAHATKLPDFISSRLHKLETLVNMVGDAEWQLPQEDLDRVLKAMAYFANPEDLIPDRVPGVGFLDDAIMAELVVENLESEITAYDEFCAYRSAEEKRETAAARAAVIAYLTRIVDILRQIGDPGHDGLLSRPPVGRVERRENDYFPCRSRIRSSRAALR